MRLGAAIVGYGKRVLWTGEINLGTMGFGDFDEALADEFAKKLLTQLSQDRVIRLSSAEIQMPRASTESSSASGTNAGVAASGEPGGQGNAQGTPVQ